MKMTPEMVELMQDVLRFLAEHQKSVEDSIEDWWAVNGVINKLEMRYGVKVPKRPSKGAGGKAGTKK